MACCCSVGPDRRIQAIVGPSAGFTGLVPGFRNQSWVSVSARSGLPPRPLEETFRCGTDHETALYLAQIAGYYEAVRRSGDARACFERALELAPENTSVLSHAANFAVAQRRWQEALAHSRKALEKNPHLGHAKLIQGLALFETGEAEQAEKLVDEVLLESPNDSYTLFLSARIRKTLNDYSGEAASLEKLVTNAKNAGVSPVDYQIYLAQAYARQELGRACAAQLSCRPRERPTRSSAKGRYSPGHRRDRSQETPMRLRFSLCGVPGTYLI